MKPINVVVVFTCADTGKAYAIDLEKTQIGSPLILGMLSVEGPLHAVEVEPFVLRSKGMSDERAAQLLAMQELTDMRQEGEADGTFKHSGTHQGGTMRVPSLPQNLPREASQDDGREIDRIGVEAEEQKHRERLAQNFSGLNTINDVMKAAIDFKPDPKRYRKD